MLRASWHLFLRDLGLQEYGCGSGGCGLCLTAAYERRAKWGSQQRSAAVRSLQLDLGTRGKRHHRRLDLKARAPLRADDGTSVSHEDNRGRPLAGGCAWLLPFFKESSEFGLDWSARSCASARCGSSMVASE